MTPTARSVAYEALLRIDHDGAYANLVLPALLGDEKLSQRDRAFATELVYGTTRMRRACDALVERFLLREPQPEVRTLLRLGAYQLEHAQIAAHAAVGETVELAPRNARGFVNAILRNVARTPMIWPDDATRLSYPDWIVERLHVELGDDAMPALERMDVAPPVTVRADGYVQDRASTWVADCVEAAPGERVLDVCAAPGGKSTAIAARGAFVVAADLSRPRAGLLARNLERSDDAVAVVADGSLPPFAAASFDHALVDAPCSGLGALRRRPDARWRIQPADIETLVTIQRSLLASAAPLVRPGGTLTYSVCTLTAAESTDHPRPEGFDVEAAPPPNGQWRPIDHGWRVLPQDDDTDGMVVIRYRRRS